MRYLLVLALVALTCANTLVVRPKVEELSENLSDSLVANNEAIEVIFDSKDNNVAAYDQRIVSWVIKRKIKKARKQMPCGWPEYGIPPLAPLKTSEADINLRRGGFETHDNVNRFRIDGLDNFYINKFRLNMILSKITYDFKFRNIKASADKYHTHTLLDALSSLGLKVEFEGDGTFDFGCVNIIVAGRIDYYIPILWGSTKITSMKTKVTIEKCDSHITGIAGNGAINQKFNEQLEKLIVSSVNENQDEISDKIEDAIVPKVNKMLKGTDIWTLIDLIFSTDENEDDPIVTTCVPPKDPWNP